ncbi:MAG: hypothetical protein LUD16_06985 [Lachnospiraceae bacterium]|nr:hypothetical protein [Lachnospiraceae bacterium]
MYICRICANEMEESQEACPYCGCPPGFPLPPGPLADETRYRPLYVKHLRGNHPLWIYWDGTGENRVFIRKVPRGERGKELSERLEQIREAGLPIFPVITEIRMPTEAAEGYYVYVAPDGVTLSERLERERPLELSCTIRVEEELWKAYEMMKIKKIRHGSLEPSGIYLDGDGIVLDYFEADAVEEEDQTRIWQILDDMRKSGCLQTGDFYTDSSVGGRIRQFFRSLKG